MKEELFLFGLTEQYELMNELFNEVKEQEIINGKRNLLYKYNANKESERTHEELLQNREILIEMIRALAKERYSKQAERKFLEEPEKYETIIYTLIRTQRYHLCLELYYRIVEDKENINELASKYSLGKERMTLGIVGPTKCSNLNKILLKKLKSCDTKTVISPFKIGNNWVLAKKEEFIPATLDDKVREAIEYELLASEVRKNNG